MPVSTPSHEYVGRGNEAPRAPAVGAWLRCALLWLAVAVAALAWLPHAQAQLCTATVTSLSFGNINPLSGSDHDAQTTVLIECAAIAAGLVDDTIGVCVYFDAGSGGSDGTTYRRMLLGGSTQLQYNLYKDSGRSQIWGSTTAFSSSGAQLVVVTLNGPILNLFATGSQTLTIYGRVPAAITTQLPGTGYTSSFAAGTGRIRYSLTNNLACNNSAGTLANANAFTVTANISKTCTVEADDLSFGSRTALSSSQPAQAQLRTSCTNSTPYSIGMGAGGGGTFATRRMTHTTVGGQTVGYQLYRNIGRTEIWGDGGGSTFTVSGTGSGSVVASWVYGSVPIQTTPIPGTYKDIVTVTVTY